MKTAVVTGITVQDGSYLAELLLEKDYVVIGCYRRNSTNNFERISHLKDNNFILEEFDLTDQTSCNNILDKYKPNELYNLAAQSHVGTSFKQPSTTFEMNTIGVINLLEAVRRFSPSTKMYQASTSEMFGRNFTLAQNNNKFQDENTELMPQSPYGVSKTASHHLMSVYRLAYGMYTCCGILFNHESPRRGENFVTRKITKWIGEFLNWKKDNNVLFKETEIYVTVTDKENLTFPKLRLGNLDAHRDWGHAKDYVRAMWLMMQQTTPEDYVICTGVTYTIREFLDVSFKYVGINNWEDYIFIDPEFYRPAEVDYLRGKAQKAYNNLGWKPEISFRDLVHEMVDYDVQRLQQPGIQKVETASLY